MQWTPWTIEAVNFGLNESQLCGIRYEPAAATARMYVELIGHPVEGSGGFAHPDSRRVLVLRGVTSLEFRLRFDPDRQERPDPITSLAEVERLFATSWISEPMYGWDFLDNKQPHDSIRQPPDLEVGPGPSRTGHSIDWFVEMIPDETSERLCLDGTCYFEELTIEHADGSVEPIEVFDANAVEHWKTVFEPGREISTAVFRAAEATRRYWRPPSGCGPLVET